VESNVRSSSAVVSRTHQEIQPFLVRARKPREPLKTTEDIGEIDIVPCPIGLHQRVDLRIRIKRIVNADDVMPSLSKAAEVLRFCVPSSRHIRIRFSRRVVVSRTTRVTERRQDRRTIPLDTNAASVQPMVRASSWRIAAAGRSELDSTTHQDNSNQDKAADAATDPASVERRLKG